MRTDPSHTVAVLALDGVVPIDLGIPVQIFGPRPNTSYRMVVCGVDPVVRTAGGFDIAVRGTLTDLARADTVIVPGYSPHRQVLPPAVLDSLANAHSRGARMVSLCIGAFALAAAGVLEGRRVTTHWQNAAELAAAYPLLRVDPDVLYVDDGSVLTSAGVSSGIDLCLHIIRKDLGAHVANDLARTLVAAPHRVGGQTQFVKVTVVADDGLSLAPTRAWALDHLGDPITIRDLARHAGTSERTLTRRFTSQTGSPPLQWILRARIDAARDLLEESDSNIEQVAERCGLGSAPNLRLHFRRLVGTTPTHYRKQFRHNERVE
jgi:transcriptional regulator GlxA family with amidase domain